MKSPSRSEIFSKSTVMVVEDNKFQLMIIEHILKENGFQHVHSAENGARALEDMNHVMPDLIIMDIEMPEMDGITLTKTLQDDEKFCDIPIIVQTGLTESASIFFF